MNKLIIKVLAAMFTIAIMLSGCFAKDNKAPEMDNTNVTETTLQTEKTTYATIPIPDISLPEGEGLEFDFEDPTVEIKEGRETVESTKPTKPQETTKPKETVSGDNREESKQTEGATKPTEGSKPTEETTKPTEIPKPTESVVSEGPCCEYERYLKMSPADQEAYMLSFSNPMSFIEWCKNAEVEHNAHDDTILVEGGNLDIGDYMN